MRTRDLTPSPCLQLLLSSRLDVCITKKQQQGYLFSPLITQTAGWKGRSQKEREIEVLQRRGKKKNQPKPKEHPHTGQPELQKLSGHFLPHPNQGRSVLAAFAQSSLNFQQEALCCNRPFQGPLAVQANKSEALPDGVTPWARCG